MASREDKTLFATILIIYSEAVISGILIPIVGFTIPLIMISISVPFTLGGVKYYNLLLYKRLNEEIKGIPFWTGTMIDLNGVWMGIDIPIADKEEINISDQEITDYQNSNQFKNTLEQMKQDNEEFASLLEKPEQFNDTYVNDQEILKLYIPLGLTTSRQIYAFEMISAFYMIDRPKLQQSYQAIQTLIKSNGDPSKLSAFETVMFEVIKIQTTAESDKMGQLSLYLESVLNKFGISDKIAYNNQLYKGKVVQLEYIDKIHKDPAEVRKSFLKRSLPLLLSLLAVLFSIWSIVYIRLIIFPYIAENKTVLPMHELYITVLTSLAFIPIIIGVIFTMRYLKQNNAEEGRPYELHFHNTVTHKTNFENFCELKQRTREYASDSRIYKVYPTKDYRNRWKSEYFICVLPASYEDSLQFDIGSVPHKGYIVQVPTTPVVMQNIGRLYNDVPIFLMVACTYHYKRFTKIFYNYNIRQNWIEKIFLQIIASLNAKMSIMQPNQQSLSVLVKEWEEYALQQVQIFAYQKALQMNETIKSNRSDKLHNPNQEEEEQQSPQLPPVSSKKRTFLMITIIAIIIIVVAIVLGLVLMPKGVVT